MPVITTNLKGLAQIVSKQELESYANFLIIQQILIDKGIISEEEFENYKKSIMEIIWNWAHKKLNE